MHVPERIIPAVPVKRSQAAVPVLLITALTFGVLIAASFFPLYGITGKFVFAAAYSTVLTAAGFLLLKPRRRLLFPADELRKIELAATIFRSSTEGFIITGESGSILAVNPAFTAVTGYSEHEVRGKNPKILQSGRHDEVFYRLMWDSIRLKGKWEGEVWDRKKTGETFPQWLSISAVPDSAGTGMYYVGFFHDISTLKAREALVEYNSQYDRLTDLPNRTLLLERLQSALRKAAANRSSVALLVIDLDNFKEVNDVIGFTLGDRLLREISSSIARIISPADVLARTEGDEFTLLLHEKAGSDTVAEVAESILEVFRNGFTVNGKSMYISASIGISLYPDDGEDYRSLLRCADLALLRAKAEEKNAFHFFTTDLNVRAQKRLMLETSLRKAVDEDRLGIAFQPIVHIENGALSGCEALARLTDPHHGAVPPDQFIPLAEETGIIVSLGEWIIRESCLKLRQWQEKRPDMRVCVNLSARQFLDQDLHQKMRRIFEETEIDPERFTLELTENSIIRDIDESVRILFRLKDMGVHISVDDFGTGYSSLSYLKKLPLDNIKIDRSFIQDLYRNKSDPSDASIVIAIISMGHSLGMTVTAEGIETEKQFAFLLENGCDFGQGYYFSPPVSSSVFDALLDGDGDVRTPVTLSGSGSNNS